MDTTHIYLNKPCEQNLFYNDDDKLINSSIRMKIQDYFVYERIEIFIVFW